MSSTNLLRVNDTMIKPTKANPSVSAVNLGLLNEAGEKKFGSIYIGEKQINADKATEKLADSQKKSYVALSRDKSYDFVMSEKQPDGSYKSTTEKMKGSDIIDMNQAYMKDLNAKRAEKAAAMDAPETPAAEAEAAAPEMG